MFWLRYAILSEPCRLQHLVEGPLIHGIARALQVGGPAAFAHLGRFHEALTHEVAILSEHVLRAEAARTRCSHVIDHDVALLGSCRARAGSLEQRMPVGCVQLCSAEASRRGGAVRVDL